MYFNGKLVDFICFLRGHRKKNPMKKSVVENQRDWG